MLANTTHTQERVISKILYTENFEYADELSDVLCDLDDQLTEALEKINELEHEKQELLSELVDARAEIL